MKFKKDKPVDMAEPDIELPRSHSSINGTTFGYTVEAKVDMFVAHRPIAIPRQNTDVPMILTEEWQQVSFWEGRNPFGVPIAGCGHHENLFSMHDLLERGSAIALAYTLAAQHSRSSMTAIKIRLRQHKLQYAHKVFYEGEPEELTEHFGKIDKLFSKQELPTKGTGESE